MTSRPDCHWRLKRSDLTGTRSPHASSTPLRPVHLLSLSVLPSPPLRIASSYLSTPLALLPLSHPHPPGSGFSGIPPSRLASSEFASTPFPPFALASHCLPAWLAEGSATCIPPTDLHHAASAVLATCRFPPAQSCCALRYML